MAHIQTSIRFIVGAVFAVIVTAQAAAQQIDPFFSDEYTLSDLGIVPGVPTPYGGVTFNYDDPNIMLIGGSANNANGAIYQIEVARGCFGQIVGFVGEASEFASAPNIDGGLTYGPDNILFFTTFSNNTIGQILPGSTEPDKIIELTPLGIASSTGSLMFVPDGFAGAGSLKIVSFNASNWYDASVVPDGSGTYDIVDVGDAISIGGGPEGIVFISDNNPLIDADSVLVSKFDAGQVDVYEINGNGDPIVEMQQTFVTGLSGAEGAAIDPVIGEFVFSTFGGGDRVIIVRGFVELCPADIVEDGEVNVADLLAVLAAWGESCVSEDLNNDKAVDVADLLTLLAAWGPCE